MKKVRLIKTAYGCFLYLKNNENKYEIIKRFRDNISELAFLTITIDGVSKTVFVDMYM